MTIQVPNQLLKQTGLSERGFKTELAVWLYQKEIFILAQAARFLGISRLDMQRELASRDISLHISPDDVVEDFDTLKSLGL